MELHKNGWKIVGTANEVLWLMTEIEKNERQGVAVVPMVLPVAKKLKNSGKRPHFTRRAFAHWTWGDDKKFKKYMKDNKLVVDGLRRRAGKQHRRALARMLNRTESGIFCHALAMRNHGMLA